MDAERYERLSREFEDLRTLDSASQQERLDALRAEDAALATEIEELLSEAGTRNVLDDSSGQDLGFLEVPARSEANPHDAGVPESVGPFRILRRIGEGGMGVVFEAEQQQPHRRVAIKLMHPYVLSTSMLVRFEREAEILARLQHPGIAQVYEVGTYGEARGSRPYFAMELVEGIDLRTFVDRESIDVAGIVELLIAVAEAVDHAFTRGIVHRDLKPDNVLVTPKGRVKVLDFGIARVSDDSSLMRTAVTESGQLIGTLNYMAPEQLSLDGADVSGATDVYALGVLAFELLAGALPRDLAGLPFSAALRTIAEEEAPPLRSKAPHLRGDLETIVGMALESEPERRYARAGELAADLRRFREHRAISAHPPSRFYRVRKLVRRHRGLAIGSALAVLALLVGTILALTFAFSEQEQRATADEQTENARKTARAMARSLLLATSNEMERGDLWAAGLNHRMISPEYRGWEWRYLARRLPHVIPYRIPNHKRRIHPGGRYIHFADHELRRWDLVEERWAESLIDDVSVGTLSNFVGGRLAIGSDGPGRLRLIDSETGETIEERSTKSLNGNLHPYQIALASDGSTVACTGEHSLQLWPEFEGSVAIPLAVPKGRVDCLEFSPDGTRLAFVESNAPWRKADKDEALLRLIDVPSGDEVARFEIAQTDMKHLGGGLAYHPKGHEIALGTGGGLFQVLDARDLSWKRTLREADGYHGDVMSLRWSSDGQRIAAFERGEAYYVFDAQSGELDLYLPCAELEFNVHLDFTPDNKRLVVSSPDSNPVLIDLDAGSNAPFRELLGHSTPVEQLAVSRDGRWLASASVAEDGIRVWDPIAGTLHVEVKRPASDRCRSAYLSFSEDGGALVATVPVATDDSRMEVVRWDLATGESSQLGPNGGALPGDPELRSIFSRAVGATTTSWNVRSATSPGGDRFFTVDVEGVFGRIGRVPWEAPTHRPLAMSQRATVPLEVDGLLGTALAHHPEVPWLAILDEARLSIYDSNTLELEMRPFSHSSQANTHFPRGSLESLAWSADGSRLALGMNTASLMILETEDFTSVLELEIDDRGAMQFDVNRRVNVLLWAPDGSWLAAGSNDGVIRLWDAPPP